MVLSVIYPGKMDCCLSQIHIPLQHPIRSNKHSQFISTKYNYSCKSRYGTSVPQTKSPGLAILRALPPVAASAFHD